MPTAATRHAAVSQKHPTPSTLTFTLFFFPQLQLHGPQVRQLRQHWPGFTLLDQHLSKVALPGVPQDGEESRESLLPSSLQVDDQLPGLLSSAASTLQRRRTQNNKCSWSAWAALLTNLNGRMQDLHPGLGHRVNNSKTQWK